MPPRRGSKTTASEVIAERPIIDMHTLRLPREEAARVETFKKLHRLPTGDLYVFLMNITGIDAEGSNRVLVDYARFDADDDVRPTIDNSSMRLPREQSDRMKNFKKNHRLSVGEMLIFMLDNAKIAKDGNTRLLIDYETLSLVKDH